MASNQPVSEAGVEQTIHLLSTNRYYRVRAVVLNNPQGVRDALGITQRISDEDLIELVLALDAEEQDVALAVPYIQGIDQTTDMAYGTMVEELRTSGMLGSDAGNGAQAFLGVALGLATVAQAYFTNQAAQQQQDAIQEAAAWQAVQQANAQAEAKAAEQAQLDALKKAAPWAGAVLIILALILYKLFQ